MAKKTYQTIILLPLLLSIVIVSYIVYGIFSTEFGIANHMLPPLERIGYLGIQLQILAIYFDIY